MSWRTYTIEKGHHTSGFHWPRLHVGTYPRTWEWSVAFSEDCLYDTDGPDRLDINKLTGVSLWDHTVNSFRFGWRAAGDFIEVLPFVTTGGSDNRHTAAPLGSVLPNAIHKLTLSVGRDYAIFGLDGWEPQQIVTPPRGGLLVGYHLNPYFGGNRVAPHTMQIRLLQW